MSDEQKYTIQGLDEYIRQGEPQQRERSEAWKVAIGLAKVQNWVTGCLQSAKIALKSITVALQEKLIIKRVNGKRNGYWEFIEADGIIRQG